MPPGIALLPFFGVLQILDNQFGFDRSGFRTLVLSPAPRWQILLGKNLALLPLVLGFGLIYVVLAGLVRHVPAVLLLAALVQLLTAFLLLESVREFPVHRHAHAGRRGLAQADQGHLGPGSSSGMLCLSALGGRVSHRSAARPGSGACAGGNGLARRPR